MNQTDPESALQAFRAFQEEATQNEVELAKAQGEAATAKKQLEQVEEDTQRLGEIVEKLEEESKGKDDLIKEANEQLEEFNAEKHLLKAKLKQLLITYCSLDESSYNMDEGGEVDEWLEGIEEVLGGFKDRILEGQEFNQRVSDIRMKAEEEYEAKIKEYKDSIEVLEQEN